MYKAAIVGCGRPRTEEGATGFGMGHRHAAGYEAAANAEIVAAVDINRDNLDAFCDRHNIAGRYSTVAEMLRRERPDVVSVCLWPHLHAPVVIEIAQAGTGVRGIHCEKPMATTWGDARRMAAACQEAGIVLTFNHQRRFGEPFRKAKELLDAGAIGELERVEAFTSNLYDWGTHWLDMMFFYNDESPAEWVLGQIDSRGGGTAFGVQLEGQGQLLFRWKNGVMGLLVTAYRGFLEGARSLGCANRLIGSDGVIEVGVTDGPHVRYRSPATGGRWEDPGVTGGLHGDDHHTAAVLDLLSALEEGREPVLAARKALQSTQIIFAGYESSRRRARVDLPLTITDAPLRAMLDRGEMTTWPDAYVTANGIRLHYFRTGGPGPVVVLAHGFSDNGLCWTPLARRLEGDFDVIMYDARHHGQSEAPAGASSYADRSEDLAALVTALDLHNPVVIGHSMGAATAAGAAARHPGLISALVLEDPPWWAEADQPRGGRQDREARRQKLEDQKSRSMEWLIDKCRGEHPRWPAEAYGPWAQAKQQVSLEVLKDSGPTAVSWPDLVKAIDCPTLLVTGTPERGSLVTTGVAAEAAGLNDQVRIQNFEGASHNIRRDRIEAFTATIRAFLSEHAPGSCTKASQTV